MPEQKIACYLCEGCGIAQRLDMDRLARGAEQHADAQLVRRHEFLCSGQGLEMIRADLAEADITHLCIAACSPRAQTEVFHFPELPMSRANLREGVVWARPAGEEEHASSNDAAADLIRMAVNEVRFMNPPCASAEQGRDDHILVVGGGITGMTAAAEAARAGYRVSIVEKDARLGGAMAAMKACAASKAPYIAPEDTGIPELVAEIENAETITVYLGSTVSKVSGAPGRFLAEIASESGSTLTESFGAIIQATGFRPFDADKLSEFSYSANADVITQMELEGLAMAAVGDPIKRPSDGKEVGSVLFVQCAGQRSDREGHLSYCSGHCCATSMKQAMYFKDQNPAIDTTVLYTDLHVTGSRGEGFYHAAQRRGVTFARGRAKAISAGSSGPMVAFSDWMLAQDRSQEFDLVVLATGMEPTIGGVSGPEGDQSNAILNLDYQQGAELPAGEGGFINAGLGGLLLESPRTGVHAAGPVRRPMDAEQSAEDGASAALKAIQALENAALGQACAPRAGDMAYPEFLEAGCTRCSRCIDECPVGAIDLGEGRYPVFNESRCSRCAICVGACPEQVISMDDYPVEGFRHRIVDIDMPQAAEEKPRILVLACENSAYPALDAAASQGSHWSAWARLMSVRCLGAVNARWLADALHAGYDGIVLMGCGAAAEPNDDLSAAAQCPFGDGLALAASRVAEIGDVMQQLGLESDRVAIHSLGIGDAERAPALINQMQETITRIGLNPHKGKSHRGSGTGGGKR